MNLQQGSEVPEIDVIIVGAGLSGLTSAIKIIGKEKSLNVKIIEESGEAGGLLNTSEWGKMLINGEQEALLRLMNILHVSSGRRYNQTFGLKRYWDLDMGFTSYFAKFELNRYINMLEARMQNYRPGRVRLRKCSPSMLRHIHKCLFFNKSRQFMKSLVELTCGVDAKNITFDEFMSVCSTCGGLKTIMDLYINVPNTLYEFSSKNLLNTIMERIKYADFLYKRKVVRIKHYRNYVELNDSSGETHMAFAVILAIPWNKVEEINFDPPIPKEFKTKRLVGLSGSSEAKRQITSFLAHYQQSWWGLTGYSGNFLCSNPLIIGHESSPTTFTGLTLHAANERKNVRTIVLEALSKAFGNDMLEPVNYEQFTFDISQTVNSPQTKPWHRVIWSSSAAVATYYRNQVGGAVESGLRAGINALFLVRPQVVSWRDLMDIEFKNPYSDANIGWANMLFSRLNMYNVAFYSIFVVALIFLLDHGYTLTKSTT